MTAKTDPFSRWVVENAPQSTIQSEKGKTPTTMFEQGDYPFMNPLEKKQNQVADNDPFSKWDAKQIEEEPSLAKKAGRHLARTGSRIIETIAGMPADVANFTKFLLKKVPAIGGVVGTLASKFAPEQYEKAVEKISGPVGQFVPGSQELKEKSEELTQGFTAPQTPEEEKSDEIVQDITALLMPIKGKMPSITKALGIELAAQGAKEGIKMVGGSENTQNLTKAAVMFTGGLLRPKNALDYAESLYKKADSLLPKDAAVNAKKLESSLNSLISKLEKGVETTDKKQVIKPAKELIAKIKDGKINVDELTAAKRDINKLRGDPETVKGAKKFLSTIGKDVDHAIDLYKDANPKFYKSFREANEAWGTIAQSKKFSNWINSHAKTLGLTSGIATLFETAIHGPGIPIAGAAATGSAYGLLKSSELLYRIMNSPVLRKHYIEVVKAAMQENGPATVKALKDLDKLLVSPRFNNSSNEKS